MIKMNKNSLQILLANENILRLLFYQFYNNFLQQSILTLSSEIIISLANLICIILYPDIEDSSELTKCLYELFPKSFVDLTKFTENMIPKKNIKSELNSENLESSNLMNNEQWKEYLCNELYHSLKFHEKLKTIEAITLFLSFYFKTLKDNYISFPLKEFQYFNENNQIILEKPNETNE